MGERNNEAASPPFAVFASTGRAAIRSTGDGSSERMALSNSTVPIFLTPDPQRRGKNLRLTVPAFNPCMISVSESDPSAKYFSKS